jgi:hypothetical protein
LSPLPSTNSETNAPDTRVLSWIVFVGALLFIGLALTYWIRSKDSLTDCIFGHPDCSNAAATWTLFAATVCAFIAAYEAAMKAGAALRVSQEALRVSQEAFNIETEPMLGEWLCTNEEGHKAPRAIVFIEDQSVSISMPKKYTKDLFVPLHFDFENLGRTALRGVTVVLHLEWDEETTRDQTIPLGSIGAHRDAHVSIFLLWDFPTRPKIGWLPEATILTQAGAPDAFKPVPLAFSPYPMVLVEGPIENLEATDQAAPASSTAGEQTGHAAETTKAQPATTKPEEPARVKAPHERLEGTYVPQPPPKGARWDITTVDAAASKKRDQTPPASSPGAKRAGSTVTEDQVIP